jgi:multiple sugar transport system substrate-binding protein
MALWTARRFVDGWTQMLVYRADPLRLWALSRQILRQRVCAVDALHNPPEMYGFVAATKTKTSTLCSEHVFLSANGVSVGRTAQVLDEAATIEVLTHKAIAEASPR